FSFIGLAREAGYNSVHEFDDLASLEDNIETVLNQAGPTFVCLKVPPLAERPPYPFLNTARAIPRFREAVQRPSP
ncbi:MAG: hypothetical protein U1B77_01015, partial [Dehalococcoidales bacterium]|nr:hypothetical protein [Dehalococcoidales bacterium]